MAVINTNVKALFSQAALSSSQRAQTVAMQQLSTGKRINTSRDDAAGMAIATRMTHQIRSMNQAIRNANDALSMIQTAESATTTINDMLTRMRELAIQASNDTNSNDQRSFLDLEFQQLKKEIVSVSEKVEWNGFPLLNGKAGTPVGEMPVLKVTSDGQYSSKVEHAVVDGSLTNSSGTTTLDSSGTGTLTKSGTLSVQMPEMGTYPKTLSSANITLEDGTVVNLLDKGTAQAISATEIRFTDTVLTDGKGTFEIKATSGTFAQYDQVSATIGRSFEQLSPMRTGDLMINGEAVPSATAVDTVSPTGGSMLNNLGSAIARSAAINEVSGKTGVTAVVQKNVMTGAAMDPLKNSDTLGEGTVTINGYVTGKITTTLNNVRASREEAVRQINKISHLTGVVAVDTGVDSQGVTLTAQDGRNIEVAFNTKNTSSDFSTLTGLKQGINVGGYALESKVEQKVVITSAPAGDVSTSGLRIGDFTQNISREITSNRAPAAPPVAQVTKVKLEDEAIADGANSTLTINGINVSVAASDVEINEVTFEDMKAGQSITIAGLTLTAEADLTAETVAKAYSNLASGTTAVEASISNYVNNGTWSGALTDFSAGPRDGDVVTFASASANTNVDALPVKPGGVVTTVDGDGTTAEESTIDFANAALAPGQSITVAGLKLTADLTGEGISAEDVAAAFAGLSAGVDGTTLGSVTGGSWSGALAGYDSVAGTGTSVVFTSTLVGKTNVADLEVLTDAFGVQATDGASGTPTAMGTALALANAINNNATLSASVFARATQDGEVYITSKTPGLGFTTGSYDGNLTTSTVVENAVGNNRALQQGDLVINGVAIPGGTDTADILTNEAARSSDNSGSAIAIAAAINSKSGETGVKAVANAAVMSATSAIESNLPQSGYYAIYVNGTQVVVQLNPDDSKDVRLNRIIAALKRHEGQTGVEGSINKVGGLELRTVDGRNLSVWFDPTQKATDGSVQYMTASMFGLATGTPGPQTTKLTLSSPANLTDNGVISVKINNTVINAKVLDGDSSDNVAEALNAAIQTAVSAGDANLLGIKASVTGSVITLTTYNPDPNLTSPDTRNSFSVEVLTTPESTFSASLESKVGTSTDWTKLTKILGEPVASDVLAIENANASSVGAKTIYGSVTLTSDKAYTIAPGSSGLGADSNFTALGFVAGTFGGASSVEMSPPRVGRMTFQVGPSVGNDISFDLADFGKNGPITQLITWDVDLPNLAPGESIPTPGQDNPIFNGVKLTRSFIGSKDGALEVLAKLDATMDKVNAQRATMGSIMNRLDQVVTNLTNVSMNMSASRSQIEDADYAAASTELAKTQIMQQAATAVLAQANTSQQSVLKLLGG
jgi:flagellin